jgi:solute carrier family 15 oligopeptide transporter 1
LLALSPRTCAIHASTTTTTTTTIPCLPPQEVCERFAYYGLRAVLVLYFEYGLGWAPKDAIAVFSYWTFLVYFMPLLGGWLADSKLGKFNTIWRFSIIYCLGSFVLAMSAIGSGTGKGLIPTNGTANDTGSRAMDDQLEGLTNATGEGAGAAGGQHGSAPLAIIGLVLIAVGTGGIKPCVSSFGADQFVPGDKSVSSFFLVFYFCINLGSVFSIIVTPILRAYVEEKMH